jgi:hypothetical protein
VANEVKLKIKIDDDGSLSVLASEAGKAAGATEKLNEETKEYSRNSNTAYRNAQGLANNSSNLSKNFSKQAQGIRGMLVPAYATLAANVFAISAAFNFFKRAFDVQALEQSQVAFAENTGVALGALTQGLRDASDGMLGFKEAGQAAAIGLAKGFSPQQLNDLAEGARKASTALGRDFQDSFDRLVRGASKAEPELLDELGITLRLEEATKRYGDAIGVNRKELTSYQRSQAVLIETQRQLNENFGDVDAISNPFIKLQKTFEDLVKDVTGAVLPIFQSIADIINRSTGAAVAVFGMIGISIAKSMIPLEELSGGFDSFFKKTDEGFSNAKKQFKDYGSQIKKVDQEIKSSREGALKAASSKVIDAGGDKAQKSKILKKMKDGMALTPQEKARIKRSIREAEAEYARFGKVTKGMFAGVKIALVRDVGMSLKQTEKQAVTFGMTFGRVMKQATLGAKLLGTALKVGVAGSLKVVGASAKFAGRMMSKALNMAGFIGIFLLIKEMVVEIMNAPHSIIMRIGSAVDAILGFIMPYVDKLIKGVLLVGDKAINMFKSASFSVRTFFFDVTKAVLGNVDSLINGFIGGINGLIEKLNKFLPDDKRVELIKFKSELASGLGAAPVMGELSNMAGSFEGFADSVEGAGTRLARSLSEKYDFEGTEKRAQRLKKSAEALKTFTTQAEAMGESAEAIKAGLKKTTDAAEKGFAVAEAMGTLNLGGTLEKIRATRDVLDADGRKIGEMTVLTESDQIKALKTLREELGDITQISPQLAAAFSAAIADPKNLKALQDLEITARDATGNFMAFKTSVTQTGTAVSDALASGDAIGAAAALEALQRSAQASAASFRAINDEASAAKVIADFNASMGEGINATEYLGAIQLLAHEQQMLRVASEMSKLAMGEGAEMVSKFNRLSEVKVKLAALDLEITRGVTAERAKQIARDRELLLVQEKLLSLKVRLGLLQSAGARSGSAVGAGAAQAASNAEFLKGQRAELAKVQGELDALGDDADSKTVDAKKAELKALQASINMLAAGQLSTTLDNLASDFRKIGPEGELMAAVAEGAANMTTTFTAAFEMMRADGATASDKIQAGLLAVGSAISTVANIQKAASDTRIRALDKEIEAEKKRDGKSAASVAKIKELEKKKKQEQRKAFEQKKKTDMAQTIISTASAAMQAYAQLGPVAGAIMAAFIVAMGAQQLATISSQSFDGGAGGGVSAASKVAVGERSNSVDMAKSQGGAGELAYMRGGMGVGGPESFTPAFTGYKNRAEGGNTAFMVGEQGPEMFVPQQPGRIIPADDVSAPAPVNANINISAIDAAGVEDVLINQRGNIISMIRDAANAQGNTFLEEVNVAEL